jgi:hypothetical protein
MHYLFQDSKGSAGVNYPEVKVFRLLLYLLDRPELGPLILNETLEFVLEHAAAQDPTVDVDSVSQLFLITELSFEFPSCNVHNTDKEITRTDLIKCGKLKIGPSFTIVKLLVNFRNSQKLKTDLFSDSVFYAIKVQKTLGKKFISKDIQGHGFHIAQVNRFLFFVGFFGFLFQKMFFSTQNTD